MAEERCPWCGEVLQKVLPNSLLCEVCYTAEVWQVPREEVVRFDCAYRARIAEEQERRQSSLNNQEGVSNG